MFLAVQILQEQGVPKVHPIFVAQIKYLKESSPMRCPMRQIELA
jgi:hypothetical protein